MVASDTENIEEEEEPKEGEGEGEAEAEAGSQTDIPATAEVCMLPLFVPAIQISCEWRL